VVRGGGQVHHVGKGIPDIRGGRVNVDSGEGRDWPEQWREAIRDTGSRSPSPYSS